MEPSLHTLGLLFDQLGLPSGEEDIERFVNAHKPLADDIALADATFWSDTQAAFLRESVADDADWAEVADQLNAMLRG